MFLICYDGMLLLFNLVPTCTILIPATYYQGSGFSWTKSVSLSQYPDIILPDMLVQVQELLFLDLRLQVTETFFNNSLSDHSSDFKIFQVYHCQSVTGNV